MTIAKNLTSKDCSPRQCIPATESISMIWHRHIRHGFYPDGAHDKHVRHFVRLPLCIFEMDEQWEEILKGMWEIERVVNNGTG